MLKKLFLLVSWDQHTEGTPPGWGVTHLRLRISMGEAVWERGKCDAVNVAHLVLYVFWHLGSPAGQQLLNQGALHIWKEQSTFFIRCSWSWKGQLAKLGWGLVHVV